MAYDRLGANNLGLGKHMLMADPQLDGDGGAGGDDEKFDCQQIIALMASEPEKAMMEVLAFMNKQGFKPKQKFVPKTAGGQGAGATAARQAPPS